MTFETIVSNLLLSKILGSNLLHMLNIGFNMKISLLFMLIIKVGSHMYLHCMAQHNYYTWALSCNAL